jgi:FlaA1/EpsC-like NDP-sugar epimerase
MFNISIVQYRQGRSNIMKLWKMVFVLGGVTGVGGILWGTRKTLNKAQKMKDVYQAYYDVTNQWLKNKNENNTLAEYFKNNSFNRIAIYGMGELGTRLYEELKNSEIKVVYFIDKNAEEICYGIDDVPIVGLSDINSQEKAEVVVVTPIYDFDSIEESLLDRGIEQIVSLEDVVYEI